VILPQNDRRVDEFYDMKETWSPRSWKRLEKLKVAAGI
jgi:hypothetical protein